MWDLIVSVPDHCLSVYFGSIKTYERTSSDEKSIIDNHCYHITTKFAVGIKKNKKPSTTSYVIGYINFINGLINKNQK